MIGSILALKLVIKGPAKLFVTCRDIPNKAEKTKNNAILRDLKRLKASKPKTSIRDCFFSRLTIGQTGRE